MFFSSHVNQCITIQDVRRLKGKFLWAGRTQQTE